MPCGAMTRPPYSKQHVRRHAAYRHDDMFYHDRRTVRKVRIVDTQYDQTLHGVTCVQVAHHVTC